MANSFDSDLVQDIVLQSAQLPSLQKKLLPLRSFATDFGDDTAAMGADTLLPVQVRRVSGGDGAQIADNTTDFSTGDTNTANVRIVPKHVYVSMHVTPYEFQQGHRLEQLMRWKMHALADNIVATAFAPITVSNFGSAVATVAEASFNISHVQLLFANTPKVTERTLILSPTAGSQFLSQDTRYLDPTRESPAPGFDHFFITDHYSSMGTNVYAAALGPEAIACYSRLPQYTQNVMNELTNQQVIEIPETDLSFQWNQWVNRNTRKEHMTFDIVFGASFGGQAAAGAVVISA